MIRWGRWADRLHYRFIEIGRFVIETDDRYRTPWVRFGNCQILRGRP